MNNEYEVLVLVSYAEHSGFTKGATFYIQTLIHHLI